MKRILIALAVLLSLQVADAQVKTPEAIKKAVSAAEAAAQDAKNAQYLHDDPKENAEHVMLVDLARNDLSRNCHDVYVEKYKEMQYYSHVIHLVSRVRGTLDKDADPIKAFIDTFAAGTLSGAPKVRAMQLISEYEPHNRGAYGVLLLHRTFDCNNPE